MHNPHIVNIHEAKTHFSKLVQFVLNGEEIIIAKAGHPVVKMSPIDPPNNRIKFGTMKGKIWVSDDFDDPLPNDILDLIEGKDEDTY